MSQVSPLRLKAVNRRYSQLKKAVHENATADDSALHESETIYRQMFERNQAVNMVFDLDTGKIVEANPAASSFYGYTLEKLKTLHVTDIHILPESELQTIIARITDEKGLTFQTQHRLASGVIRDVQIFAGLLEANCKRYVYNIIHDITERKPTEKALRDRDELYHLLTQHMFHSSIVMFDADKRFTLVEGDVLRRIGLIPENMIGKLPHEVFSDETLNFMTPIYERTLKGEAFSYDRTTPDYAYQAYANPLKNATGEIIGGMFLTHDITEAKHAENALRISEARFHSLVDLAPVGIIQTDAQGDRIFCNSHWCEMTGISLEQALNDPRYDTIYPEDLPIAADAWNTMMETHVPFDNVFFRYQRPDKTTIWVSGNGRPIYDAKGEISGYLGSVTDISEHKLLEEALTTSESRFRTLIDFAPVGIVETDIQGMVILGNECWSMLSGISQDCAYIDNGTETIHLDDLPTVQAMNHKMQENLTPIDGLEYRFLHPNGNIVWVSDSSRPIVNLDGNMTGFIHTLTDITERKRLEEALRQNEERLRNITDNLEDLVSQSDNKGRFVFVSRSYQTVLGYEPESLIGTSAFDLVHPEDLPALAQARQNAVKMGNQQVTFESRLRHADGHYIHVESVGKIFFSNPSGLQGGIFISRDISERLRVQNLLLQTEKLQTALDKELELNNLKTRMMNRIEHEFRTPLTIIQATTETLTYYLDRLSHDQRKAKEATIKGQIQRLSDMLDEIGQVIKTDFTPDLIPRTRNDLSALCRKVAIQIEQELKQPNHFELELPEKAEVSVDPHVVENAFFQVMHNAARFSKLSTPVKVSLSCAENSITLKVTDTGIGILPNEQPRIFEPFFRGSNIGESSGLGVGLTMTRAAIEAYGGTITVDSELDKGTTVTIWLPV